MALQLEYGVRQKVFITHVADDGTFFVQLDSDAAYGLPDLSQSIQIFIESKGKTALVPEYGLKCFAFSTRDQAWYRALISEVDGSKIVVYYVDYGNTEKIPVSQLNAPTDNLFESPYQVVCCSMSDFFPSKNGSQRLSGFLLEKEYSGNFVSRSPERHPYLSFLPCNNLSLFEDESTTESIAQQLVLEGLGQFRICTGNIKIGSKQKVYTCFHDSPGKFWVQLADCQNVLDTIMDDLNDPNTVGRLKPLTAEALSPSVACCCQYSENNQYHRAEVISKTKSPTRFKVSFVDYGNCEVVDLSDIKELPARLALIPFCAIQCCLEGVTPVKQEKPDPKHGSIAWNPKACDAFVSITNGKELDALFVSEFSPEIFNVKLTDTESNEEIAHLLAQSGHANLSVEYDTAPAVPEEYQYVNMDVGKTYKGVYITHADSPSVVWCQLPDQVEEFNDLLDKLAECDPSLPRSQILEENQPCCVKYSVDQSWCRGLVSSVDNSSGTAQIFFVDYGNSEPVNLADVREPLADFFSLPAQAVSFSLAEMSPISGGEWSQSAISAFQELVVDKYLDCEVVGLDDDGYPSAKLFNNLQENKDIGLELIRQNHAKAPLGSAANKPNFPTKSQEQLPHTQSYNSQSHSQSGTTSHMSHSRTDSKGSNQSPFQSKKASPAHSFSSSESKSWSRQRHPSNRSNDGSTSGRARQMGRSSFGPRDSSSGSSHQGSQDRSSSGHRPARYRRVRLQTGEAYDVCVCHVESFNEFYCQLHRNAVKLSEVMQEIDQHCSSPSARPLSSPSPNMPVLARYSGDGSWYRAIVKEPPNEKGCRIFFVDYGNSETVPANNLVEMPPPFLSLESQAIQCALIGVPRDFSPPESTIDTFGELTIEKDFRFNVKKFVRDKELNVGELLCEDGSSFIDHLKEKGLLPTSSSSRIGPTTTKKSFTEFKKDASPQSTHKGFGRDASPKSPRQNRPPPKSLEIPLPRVPVNESVDVISSVAETPTLFYLQLSESYVGLEQLTTGMNEFYKKIFEYEHKLSRPQVGDFCAAKYSEDGVWYRARVSKVTTGGAEVIFVDYGNSETISLANLKVLQSQFTSLPCIAIPCTLAGLPTNASEAAAEKFVEKVTDCKLVAQFKQQLVSFDTPISVKLFDTSVPDKDINIADYIISATPTAAASNINQRQADVQIAPITPVMNSPMECSVLFVVNPGEFYCQLTSESGPFDSLMNKLYAYYGEQEEGASLTSPTIGSYCAAPYSDGSWYRGRITAVNPTQGVSVHYIDYGNTDQVEVDTLRELAPEFCGMPAQALKCQLNNASPAASNQWSGDTTEKFQEFVLEKTAQVVFVNQHTRGCFEVQLSVEGKDATQLLVEAGLARMQISKKSMAPSSAQNLTISPYPAAKGSQYNVLVTFAESPHEFYCQVMDPEEKLDALMIEINKYCQDPSSKSPAHFSWKSGDFALAQFSEDKMWYRSRITKMLKSGTASEVHYIDHGNNEVVSSNQLRPLKPGFCQLPCQALKCRLNGSEVYTCSKEKQDIFSNLILNSEFSIMCTSVSSEGNCAVDMKRRDDFVDMMVLAIDEKIFVPKSVETKFLPAEDKINLVLRNTVAVPIKMVYPGDVAPDSFHDVTVSHVESPSLLFCQFSLYMARHLEILMGTMQEHYMSESTSSYACLSSGNCKTGMFVAAQYSADNLWYRAAVTTVQRSDAEVYFVDYGNRELVPFSRIKPLNPEFAKLPAQAIPCSLAEIAPSGRGAEWSDEATEIIFELVNGKSLVAQIKGHTNLSKKPFSTGGESDEILEVSLIDSLTVIEVELISRKLAVHVSPAPSPTPARTAVFEEAGSSKKTSLTFQKFSTGQICEASVSHIESPSSFWTQMPTADDDLADFNDRLASYYTSDTADCLRSVSSIGSICCAKYSEDQSWYRGVIKSTSSDGVEVCFVDYGNSEVITPSDVKVLGAEFQALPVQAIECKLHNCLPLPGAETWSDDAIGVFSHLVLDKDLSIKFVGRVDNVWEVEVCYEGEDVTTQLLHTGLVAPIESEITENAPEVTVPIVIPTVELQSGHTYPVYIAFNDAPNKFYCQLVSDSDKLESLMAEIADFYNGNHLEPLIEVGAYCVAQYSGNSAWYRAKILSIDPKGEVEVHFIDYGNSEYVSSNQILALESRFAPLPAQAFCCTLIKNVADVQFNSNVMDAFISIDLNQEFNIKVTGSAGDRYLVNLYDQSGYLVNDSILGMYDRVEDLIVQPAPPVQSPPQQQVPPAAPQPIPPSQHHPPLPPPQQVIAPMDLPVGERPLTEHERRKEYTQLKYHVGQTIDVYKSVVESPTSFYCQPLELTADLEDMMSKLGDFMSKSGPRMQLDPASLTPGQVCLARYSDDNEWYRAKIEGEADGGIMVTFVDYGNYEVTTPDGITQIPAQFLLYSVQAIHCSVFEGLDASMIWSPEQVTQFQNLIPESEHLTLKVCGLSSEQYYVEICNNGEKMDFSSLLEQHIDQVSAAAAQPQIYAQQSSENSRAFKPIQDELPDFTQSPNAAVKTESESENGETESDTGSEGKPLIKAPFKLSLAVANESVNVSVVYVQSPSLLYVQRVDCQAELVALSDEIEQYCSSFDNVESEFPQPFHQGDFVLAKFAEDGVWYRAEVIGVDSDGTAKVTFIDYGNQEVILPKDLMMCPENLLELPVQAIPCCLAEVPRRESDSWPPSYKELIDSLVTDKVLKATVVMAASQGMMSTIKLFDTEAGVDINDYVLAKLQDECEMSTSDIIAEEPEPEGEIPDDVIPIDEEIEAQGPPSPPLLPTQDLLQPGTSHDVYVIMCTGPQSFVCQLASASEALESIATKLSELYTGSGEGGGEQYALQAPPNEGDFVVAMFSDDSLWYRAHVTKVCDSEDGKSCEVLFVDYGNSETVPVENLRIPDPSITTHPPLAFECYLTGVEMPTSKIEGEVANDDLLTKVAQEMAEIIGNDICTAEIVTMDDSGCFGVALTNSTTGKNVASLLIQAELVSPIVPRTSASISEEREERFVEALDDATELQLPEDQNSSTQEIVVLPMIQGLDPGTTHNVFIVSCISLHSFACQLSDTTELLESISAQLAELYATVGVGYNLYTLQGAPKVGDFVVALFSDDQQWYRARVRACLEDGQSCEVVFIDYGNSDIVLVENMRKPDPSLAIHPPLAFECFLNDIEEYSVSDDGLKQKAAEKMTKIIGEDSCTAEIVRVDDSGHFGVILKTLATEESVGALLVEAKLASYSSASAITPAEPNEYDGSVPCESAPDTKNPVQQDTQNLLLTGSSDQSIPTGEFPEEKVPTQEEDAVSDGEKEATSDGLQELKTTEWTPTTTPPDETTSQEKEDGQAEILGELTHKQPLDPLDLHAGFLKQQLPNRQELQPATTHEVYVISCASPCSFVCQLSDNSDALDSITTLLAKLYSTEGESKSYILKSPPKEGDFVVALFSQDQEWYRAVVTKLSDEADSCQVSFIDFGNSETVPMENLRAPDSSLAIHPPLAFQCFLSGIEPHSSDQDEFKTAAVEEFMKLIDDKSCTIEVLTIDDDGRYGVVLTTSSGVNVGSSLIAAKLASPLVPTPSTLQSGESTTQEEANEGEKAVVTPEAVGDQDTATTETTDLQTSDSAPTAVVEDLEEPLPLPPSDVPSDAPLEIATSFTKLTLEVGQQYSAEVVSVATLEEFVCRVTTKEKELGDLMDDISRQRYVFGEEDALTVSVPKKGLPVAACSLKDSCWCRAEIDSMGLEPNSVCVTYIDLGSTETLSLDRVRHLEKRFADALPTLCVTCSLPILKENDLNPLQFAGEPWELMWPISCIKQFAQLTDTKRTREEGSGLYLEVIETNDDGYMVKVIKHLTSGEEIDIREALIEKLREPKKIELDDSNAAEDGTINDEEEALLDAEVMKTMGGEATTHQGEPTECVYSVATGDETVTLRTRTPTPQPTTDQDGEGSNEGDQTKPEEDGTGDKKSHENANNLDQGATQKESDGPNAKRMSQSSLGSEEDEWADASQDLTEMSASDALPDVVIPDVPLAASELLPIEASKEGIVGKMELVNGNGTGKDMKPCLSQDLAISGKHSTYGMYSVHVCICTLCIFNSMILSILWRPRGCDVFFHD